MTYEPLHVPHEVLDQVEFITGTIAGCKVYYSEDGEALILTGDSECVISVEPPDVLLPGFNNGNATTHSAYLASMPVEELVSAAPMAADDLGEYKGWSTGWEA